MALAPRSESSAAISIICPDGGHGLRQARAVPGNGNSSLINELQRESARALHWACTTTVRHFLTGSNLVQALGLDGRERFLGEAGGAVDRRGVLRGDRLHACREVGRRAGRWRMAL